MRAVVQQDDVAAPNLTLGAGDDLFSRLRFPVVTGDVPHYSLQPEGSHCAQRGRTAPAKRRPEDLRFYAGGIKDGLPGLHKLAAQLGHLFKDQVRMAPRVAANGVTGGNQGARNLGLLLNVLSDEEKRCLHAVAFQHFDHAPGIRIVGPVIVGERQQARAGPEANECSAVDLRGGRHGVVARHARPTRNGRPANKQWKHWLDCSRRAALRLSLLAFRSSFCRVPQPADKSNLSAPHEERSVANGTTKKPSNAKKAPRLKAKAKSERRRANSEERSSDEHLLSRQLRTDREQDILRFVAFYSHGEPFRTTPVHGSRRSDTSRQEHPLPGHRGNPARAAHHRARAQSVPATVLRRRAWRRLPGAVRFPHRAL